MFSAARERGIGDINIYDHETSKKTRNAPWIKFYIVIYFPFWLNAAADIDVLYPQTKALFCCHFMLITAASQNISDTAIYCITV